MVDPFLPIGGSFATYDETSSLLTLHSDPPSTLKIPTVRSLFTTVINGQISILGITPDYLIVRILANIPGISPTSPAPTDPPPITQPGLELDSITKLPLGDKEYPALKLVIPVDPMGWTELYDTRAKSSDRARSDALLSVSEDGELVFWTPQDQLSSSNATPNTREVLDARSRPDQSFWKCTGTVRTGRKGLRIAACSSTKKSVLGIYRH